MLNVIKLLRLTGLLLMVSVAVQAQETTITQMKANITEKMAKPEMKRFAIVNGKERAVLCNQCHGEDGNSVKPGIPNLAAQNPMYLVEQIEKFSDGRRKNYVMNALSKNFTTDDKENLAIFYASMSAKLTKTNPKLAAKGKSLYAQQCSACHGEKGAGQANFARLAGQQIEYVETTLKQFRDNTNNDSADTKRQNIIMDSIAQKLTDEDVSALAAYVAQLE